MRLIILIAVFAAGYFVGVYAERGFGAVPETETLQVQRAEAPASEPPVKAARADVSGADPVKAATPSRGGLSETQRSLIRSFGLDPDTITVTQEMLSCAREKLGSARYDELLGGSLPSLTESASLLSCYRQ